MKRVHDFISKDLKNLRQPIIDCQDSYSKLINKLIPDMDHSFDFIVDSEIAVPSLIAFDPPLKGKALYDSLDNLIKEVDNFLRSYQETKKKISRMLIYK